MTHRSMILPAHRFDLFEESRLDREAEALRPMTPLDAIISVGVLIASGTIMVYGLWLAWGAWG